MLLSETPERHLIYRKRIVTLQLIIRIGILASLHLGLGTIRF